MAKKRTKVKTESVEIEESVAIVAAGRIAAMRLAEKMPLPHAGTVAAECLAALIDQMLTQQEKHYPGTRTPELRDEIVWQYAQLLGAAVRRQYDAQESSVENAMHIVEAAMLAAQKAARAEE